MHHVLPDLNGAVWVAFQFAHYVAVFAEQGGQDVGFIHPVLSRQIPSNPRFALVHLLHNAGKFRKIAINIVLIAARGVAPAGGVFLAVEQFALGRNDQQRRGSLDLLDAKTPGNIEIAALARLRNADIDDQAAIALIRERVVLKEGM